MEKVDVTSESDCKSFISNVASHFGKIDVLVNNAGIALMGDMATFPEEIANAIVFLSSEPVHYITGVSINVDSGMVKSFI